METRGGRLSPEAVSASGVPAGVGEVVAQRVACLPEKASQLLTVAAVVGEEFSLGLVADSLDLNNQEVALPLVEAALLAGLVGEVPDQPGWFRFSHALIREVLYEAPTALRRAYLHRRVGDALEHELEVAGGDIVLVELAHHYYRAAPVGGSDKAISYALRASDQAMQHAETQGGNGGTTPRSRRLHLQPGDFLIFEERIGPKTGPLALPLEIENCPHTLADRPARLLAPLAQQSEILHILLAAAIGF